MRWVMLAVVLFVGCDQKPEPTFKGKRQSEWVTLASDADATTRAGAYRAVGTIGGDVAIPVLTRGIEDPDISSAFIAIGAARDFKGLRVASVRRIEKLLRERPAFVNDPDVYGAVMAFGPDAMPLRPFIAAAKLDEATSLQKISIALMLAAIDGKPR